MAKENKSKEKKLILEREYIIPLRKEWLKVPEYKRASRAVKTLKKFLVRHMGIYDRDLKKIKIDILLNNELRFRGIKKPPMKIKVKAKKYDNNEVLVELVNIPEHIKYDRLRKEKKDAKIKDKVKEIEKEKKPIEDNSKKEKEQTEEQKEETKEKEEASKENSLKKSKEEAKSLKHISKKESMKVRRRDLSK